MKKLLLTGFEPFLEFPINPTADIAKELDGTKINDYEITSEILTVDFHQSGTAMIEKIKEHDPDAVIALGLAGGRHCVTPERVAINCNDGPKDNRGYEPKGERIFAEGPDAYFSTLPIYEMIQSMKEAGLPAKISNTAGTYLCNNVMYHAIHYYSVNNLDRKAGFIHVPASHALALEKSLPSWSHEDLVKAIRIAITCLN
ncbi:pyroglutamyl-peptidase I [Virgibacillus sp. FSP13]